MIAFDLVCTTNEHRFEGWFASSAEYDRQLGANLLCCPVCGTAAVTKAVMAPNIGRKGNQQTNSGSSVVKREEDQTVAVSNQPEMPGEIAKAIAELSKLQSKMLENSAWVGDKFVEEARAIHYGEQPTRIIHGEATPQQAQALFDEGVSVAPLPLPYVPPEAKN
jgi:hypothetical protein